MKKYNKILLTTTAIILLICGGGAVYASRMKPTEPPVTAQPLNATIVFNLVNKERVKAGLKPLVRDARLDATAQVRADDMVARNYFSHYDPVTGENLAKILNKYYPDPCTKVSENISAHHPTNQSAVAGWMGSKSHHDAILLPEYTLTGIAVKGDEIVQHFCISK